MSKTWFITGTSRGFGREWAIAALERGDRVAATARDVASLDDLVQTYGDALAADRPRRHRPGGRLRRGRAGARPLRRPRHRRQQRRLRALRDDRGAHRGRGAGADRRPTCSARCGSPRRRCPTCGSRGAATSSRCRRSAASRRSRWSGSTTPPSGGSRASARPWPRRSPASASTSPWSSRAPSRPTGPAPRRSTPTSSRRTPRSTAPRRRAVPRRASNPGDPVATREAILRVVDADEPPLRVFFGAAPLPDRHGRLRVAAEDLERLAGRRADRPGRPAGLSTVRLS